MFKAILAVVAMVSAVAMASPSKAAFEYTIGTETKQSCTWASAGGALYRAGLTEQGVPAGSKVRKLAKDHEFSIACKAKRTAKKPKEG